MTSKSKFRSTLEYGSDMVYDYTCQSCQDEKKNTEANYFCQDCSQCFCDSCVNHHNKVLKRHAVLGRKDVDKWSTDTALVGPLVRCDSHPGEILKLYCRDHSRLCCHVCISVDHKQCREVKHITDVAKGVRSTRDFKSLPDRVTQIKKKLSQARTMRQENMKSVSKSGDIFLGQIRTLRQHVIELFDRLEKKTIIEIDSRKTSLETKINADVDKMADVTENLQKLLDEIKDEEKSDAESYIGFNKCDAMIGTAQELVEKVTSKDDYAITFQPFKGIMDFLSSLDTLGDVTVVGDEKPLPRPDHVFRVDSSQQYSVRVAGDASVCNITGACALSSVEYLFVDNDNHKLKLFTPDFRFITSLDVSRYPFDVSCTGEHEAAVTVDNNDDKHEILLVRVQAGKMVKTRTITLQHTCRGLAHHAGQLYVTADTALYVYDLKGVQGRQLYSDQTGKFTVLKCAVSPDGSRIYIITHDQLTTLNKDGTKLSTLTHPELRFPRNVHVSSLGHVFVSCPDLGTVVQVMGQEVSTLAGKKDGLAKPRVLFFSSSTLFVGQRDTMLTIKLK